MANATFKKITNTIVIVGPVRLSYLNVFKPRMNDIRKKVEFSGTLLIPKAPVPGFCENPASLLKSVRETIETALKEKFGDIPKKYENWVLKDGDAETNNEGEPKHPGYYYISTRSDVDHPPVLVGPDRKPLIEAGELQSGYWGYAKISIYAYLTGEGTKGVSSSLRAIQKYKADETFGSGVADAETVANEFDEVEADFLA
jgi:hypothetical protein